MTQALFRDDAYLQRCQSLVTACGDDWFSTEQTVFYPMGGGQAGDQGEVKLADDLTLRIIDTRKGEAANEIRHRLAPDSPLPEVGATVELILDWPRRYTLMRLHTALHVLSCVVVAPVTGGNISEHSGRLDFDIDPSLLDAAHIEAETNRLIASAVNTETVWISDEELDAQPELVKTMSVAPPRGAGRIRLLRIPGIDLQPCGGTHVANIGEIGPIKVLKISNQGKRNKRVEIALTQP
ncbi:alanyl-tRNA editing protein [Pseudomarimonas arenosa]|uniref:Alanyl-tRNA editing protein n=1 Tax=Pseudomarimonas arenosa TaxID=2774145 RepID=A0AAW3ZQJ8_9GAMM|nr:alanyl-tRNA editing protein [Pseudomarimonas arenosa]MBD8526904.1 alanyl-tRNA editing protein [Pseudomarimonas arenosa]